MNVEELVHAADGGDGTQHKGNPSLDQALARFTSEYARSNTTTKAGRAGTRQLAVDMLSSRMVIDEWIARHPEAAAVPVEKPLFILGMPRSGTTLLVNLLRHDPARRMYWNWEANRETPPAKASELQTDPRIAKRVAEIDAGIAAGVLDPRHHLERGDEPTECYWALGRDFKSYIWMVQTQVPNYFEWLIHEADMEPAYQHHRQSLQLMQSAAPGRWTLKMPSHAAWIDALLKVYPDARFIVSHRDPVKPIASTCNIVRHILSQGNDRCDASYVGYEAATLLTHSAVRMMRARDAYPHVPFFDLHYRAFVADPLWSIHEIYAFLGEELDPEVEQRMRRDVAQHERQRAAHGAHLYDLSEFGLSRTGLKPLFAEYVDRFGIVPEKD